MTFFLFRSSAIIVDGLLFILRPHKLSIWLLIQWTDVFNRLCMGNSLQSYIYYCTITHKTNILLQHRVFFVSLCQFLTGLQPVVLFLLINWGFFYFLGGCSPHKWYDSWSKARIMTVSNKLLSHRIAMYRITIRQWVFPLLLSPLSRTAKYPWGKYAHAIFFPKAFLLCYTWQTKHSSLNHHGKTIKTPLP